MTQRAPALLLAALCAAAAACSDDVCETTDADISAVCVPDSIRSDQVVALQVREACGIGCAQVPSCTATLRGTALRLRLRQEQCIGLNPSLCVSTTCSRRVVTCELPKLLPGNYTLEVPGSPDVPLVVTPGGEPACRLPNADPASGEIH